MVSGKRPFGTSAGSSTAARNASRSPWRKASLIWRNRFTSLQRSRSVAIFGLLKFAATCRVADVLSGTVSQGLYCRGRLLTGGRDQTAAIDNEHVRNIMRPVPAVDYA